jgi:hypothetical protein
MELESLVKRMEILERQNRFFKAAGTAVLFVSCAALLIGQVTAPRTVEAERFVLRDSDGIERASLEVTNDGPRFAMYGSDHKLRLRLESTRDTSQLVFHSIQTGGTVLAPVFLGVGEREDEETGFLQLAAHGLNAIPLESEPSVSGERWPRQSRTYFIVEPSENVQGLRFYDSSGEGTLSLNASERGLELELADRSGNITWTTQ